MIDKIKSYGCSFVFGSDLSDCLHSTVPGSLKASNKTWPALIAQELELEYECYAKPGVGNNYIAQQVISNADPDSINVIVWSWIDRWEFFDITDNCWTTVRPAGTEDNPLAEIYYKYLQSELQDKWQSLNYIYSTHEYLRKHNIPFISHIMDELLLDVTYNCPPYIATLQDDTRDTIESFSAATPMGLIVQPSFLDWSQLNNYPISKGMHPLEEAHEAAARYWISLYKKEISKHIIDK